MMKKKVKQKPIKVIEGFECEESLMKRVIKFALKSQIGTKSGAIRVLLDEALKARGM